MRSAVLSALLAAGCGRLGFDPISNGDGSINPAGDASTDAAIDAPSTGIRYVKPVAQVHFGAGNTETFTIQATTAGDAIVFQVGCAEPVMPSGLSISAPGWTFPFAPGFAGTGAVWAAPFAAIAPDASPATLTVTWNNATCSNGTSAVADEFTNTDPVSPFDAVNTSFDPGDCMSNVNANGSNEAIWGACLSQSNIFAAGPGYTKSATSGTDHQWAEYKLTTSPPQFHPVAFQSLGSVGTVTTGISLRPSH